ncbi:hypothetical protein PABG_12398 [Paracoccidioides brasiliensis Pb03]|nr:hypothetical protein PABG_12398 [Paracoccidioides brasiliensis Pb03]
MYIHYGLEESKTSIPVLVAIHYPRHYRMGVSACADDEENDEEEGLEVEERSLLNISQCQPSEKKLCLLQLSRSYHKPLRSSTVVE